MRTFFPQNEHVKLGVLIIHGCALYTGKYGIASFIDSKGGERCCNHHFVSFPWNWLKEVHGDRNATYKNLGT